MARDTFLIDPVTAILTLEREGFLSDNIDETSPLRRGTEPAGSSPLVPIFWDSRDVESWLAGVPSADVRPTDRARFLYVARKGARFDGHTLVENVLAAGGLFLGLNERVCDHLFRQNRPHSWVQEVLAHPHLVNVAETEKCLERLLVLSSAVTPEAFTSIAVTGTNGKTSVTQIVGSLLAVVLQRDVLRIGTLGIQLGAESKPNMYPTMPDFPGFLQALKEARDKEISHLVFEATSHGLQERRMGSWTVDVAIFTNLTQDHLDYHKTLEAYRAAKGLLFENHVKHGGTAVINTDDPEWKFFCMRAAHSHTNCIGVGTGLHRAEFFTLASARFRSARFLTIAQKLSLRTGIQGMWRLEAEKGHHSEAPFSSELVGDFQHDNLAAAAAALIALGYPLAQVANAAHAARNIPGRLEVVRVADASSDGRAKALPTVIVDYAHSPDSLEKALKSCRRLLDNQGRLACVFGCGGDRDAAKRPLMGEIAAALADSCIVTSDNPRTEDPNAIIDGILAGAEGKPHVTRDPDRRAAIERAITSARAGDLVLIAGKGHEDYQIIGTTKLPFSDVEVARDVLRKLS